MTGIAKPPACRFSIIVVGSGLAGLATAIALSERGHHVQVLEQRIKLSDTGGGLNLGPNAVRLLNAWGIAADVREIADVVSRQRLRRGTDSKLLQSRVLPKLSEHPSWAVLRGDLQQVFHQCAVDRGINIHFGKRVTALDESGTRPVLILEDGSHWSTDLVVAADGIRSRIRSLIFPGQHVDPVASDIVTFQFTIPKSVMESHEHLRELYRDDFTVWLGPGHYVVASHNNTRGHYSVACFDNGHGALGEPGTWNEPGDVRDLRARFKMFAPQIQTLLSKVESCQKWRVAEGAVLAGYTSGNGTVILLGDAAHAMLPNAAQGLSQGIEDAAALAELLSFADSARDIPGLMRMYSAFRKPRVDIVKLFAHHNTMSFALPNGPEQERRDRRLLQHTHEDDGVDVIEVEADSKAGFRTLAFLKWIYDYDTIAEVSRISWLSFGDI